MKDGVEERKGVQAIYTINIKAVKINGQNFAQKNMNLTGESPEILQAAFHGESHGNIIFNFRCLHQDVYEKSTPRKGGKKS